MSHVARCCEEAQSKNHRGIKLCVEKLIILQKISFKDLEMAKARLRSRVVYSPLEMILKKAKDNYFAALGSSSVRKKKYGPIFV